MVYGVMWMEQLEQMEQMEQVATVAHFMFLFSGTDQRANGGM